MPILRSHRQAVGILGAVGRIQIDQGVATGPTLGLSMWLALDAELGGPELVDDEQPGRAFWFTMRSSALNQYGVNWFTDMSYTPELMVLRELEGRM